MEIIENIIKESVEEIFAEKGYINLFMVFFGIIFGLVCCISTILNLIIGRRKNGR